MMDCLQWNSNMSKHNDRVYSEMHSESMMKLVV